VFLAARSEKVALADLGLRGFGRWTLLQAVAFVVLANLILAVLQSALFTQAPQSFGEIANMIPQTLFARWMWAILCVIVAVSEEVTFRGYILTRISRLAGGRIWVGVIASTIAFASGHLYQGVGGVALIAVYGVMFAGLYLFTGSLYPGIVAHFLQDMVVLLIPSLTS